MGGEANVWEPRTLIEVSANTKRVTQRITAIAEQTLFTITDFAYVVGSGALEVIRNGHVLRPGIDFVELTSQSFTIVTPSTLDDQILVVGYVGITGVVPAVADIFATNYQALRDYAGVELTIYAQGKTTVGDVGEAFFQKVTGAAPGTYIDNDNTILVPTAGDGSAGWIRTLAATLYNNVAKLKLTKLAIGSVVQTQGYYSSGDRGAATYLVIAPQVFDGYGDHELANGNIAILQYNNYVTPEQFGADDTGAVESTLNIQACFDYEAPVASKKALYLCGQLELPDNLILLCDEVEFKAKPNLNGDLVINATTPGTNINIKGYPVFNSDQANQSGVLSRSIVLSDVSNSDIEAKVTDCDAMGFVLTTGSDNLVKVISRRVGITAAGYGCYIFNSDSNRIWSDNDDFCIGLAIEASGASETANNNIVEQLRSLNGRADSGQSGAGLHLEQSVGGLVSGTIINNPICHNSTGSGIILSAVEETSIYAPDVRGNTQEGLAAVNAVNFLIDGGTITDNGVGSPAGYQAQLRIDDAALSGSTGTVRNCKGSGTIEGVKMFVATAVDFIGCDFRGTLNDYNLTVGSLVSPTPSRRPAFEAGLSADKSAPGSIIFDTELTDQVSNYSTSTGEFIAPMRGNYHFYIQARSIATSDVTSVGIIIEGVTRASAINNSDTNNHASCFCSVTVHMAAGDKAVGTLLGGTALGDAISTKFGGYLL